MCWPPNGCMATTQQCRSWPRARRSPGGYGPMFATTGPSAGVRRRQRSTTPRAIGGASIRPASEELHRHSRRPTPIAASMPSTIRRASPRRSHLLFAGRMRAGCSSSWPTSPRMPGAATWLRRSRRLRSRRSSASMPLFDIERDINGLAADERLAVRQESSKPLLDELEAWLREQRCQALALVRRRQTDRLHAQALGRLRPLCRGWQDLS